MPVYRPLQPGYGGGGTEECDRVLGCDQVRMAIDHLWDSSPLHKQSHRHCPPPGIHLHAMYEMRTIKLHSRVPLQQRSGSTWCIHARFTTTRSKNNREMRSLAAGKLLLTLQIERRVLLHVVYRIVAMVMHT